MSSPIDSDVVLEQLIHCLTNHRISTVRAFKYSRSYADRTLIYCHGYRLQSIEGTPVAPELSIVRC